MTVNRKGFIGRLYSQQTKEKTMQLYIDRLPVDFSKPYIDCFREASCIAMLNPDKLVEMDCRIGEKLFTLTFNAREIAS